MDFTYTRKREHTSAAQRSVVMASRGMVASSHFLATLSGYKALAQGGTAVDAAVAMVATLSVVEPHSVGIGGDAFALIYLAEERKLVGMNASGRSPSSATISWFKNRGMTRIPERGILSVTVPGALHGWAKAVETYGVLPLSEAFEDALDYAEKGFPVTEVIAGEWGSAVGVLQTQPSASDTYLIQGKAPTPGHVVRNRDLARTYRTIINEGIETFYGGVIGQAVERCAVSCGGLLTAQDLRSHTTTWVTPIFTQYRGLSVYELPPNTQGVTVLQMLNILEGYDLRALQHNGPDYLHLLIEAKKLAFADRDRHVADPAFETIPLDLLCSKKYAARCRARIDPEGTMRSPRRPFSAGGSDTVYVTAVDEHRNAASFISSIFMPFGSGVVVNGTGIILQNRGTSFSLNPRHPNHLEPGKRPRHTIMPGMVFENGSFVMSFGVMGGDMQPQGQVQFLTNVIDFRMNLQEAVDAPRIRHIRGNHVFAEAGIGREAIIALENRGHHIGGSRTSVNQVGGGQAIYLDRAHNVLFGASDRRKDGCALGY